MSNGSVRGAGRDRGGATDTTMLIWKVIAANPGITRAQIWERAEHSIPAGYALRRYRNTHQDRGSTTGVSSTHDLARARRWLLYNRLWEMCRSKSIEQVGDDGYRIMREINYRGNPDAIDETGTKAAEHMALADALRTAEKMIARGKPDRKAGPIVCANRKEYDALVLVVKALRAKGSS